MKQNRNITSNQNKLDKQIQLPEKFIVAQKYC